MHASECHDIVVPSKVWLGHTVTPQREFEEALCLEVHMRDSICIWQTQ